MKAGAEVVGAVFCVELPDAELFGIGIEELTLGDCFGAAAGAGAPQLVQNCASSSIRLPQLLQNLMLAPYMI